MKRYLQLATEGFIEGFTFAFGALIAIIGGIFLMSVAVGSVLVILDFIEKLIK